MAQKRRASTPRTSLPSVAVLLEALDKKVDALAEGQRAGEARLQRSMDERFAEVNRRFEILETAVRQNRDVIQRNSDAIQRNSEDIARLEAEIRRLDRTLQGKIDQASLDSLERRVAAIESRLGIAS